MKLPRDSNIRDLRQLTRHRDRTLKNLAKRKEDFDKNPEENLARINKAIERRNKRKEKRKNV